MGAGGGGGCADDLRVVVSSLGFAPVSDRRIVESRFIVCGAAAFDSLEMLAVPSSSSRSLNRTVFPSRRRPLPNRSCRPTFQPRLEQSRSVTDMRFLAGAAASSAIL